MSDTPSQPFEFSTLSKWLHWGTLFGLFAEFLVGISMDRIANTDPIKIMVLRSHAVFGALIVFATVARIVIRLRTPQPTPEGMTERWNIWLHRAVQWAIYIVLLAVGITGLGTLVLNHMTFFNADPAMLSRAVPTMRPHVLFVLVGILLVFIHVVGAIRHQLTHSNILRRIGLNTRIGKR